jgi:hypothetical protein
MGFAHWLEINKGDNSLYIVFSLLFREVSCRTQSGLFPNLLRAQIEAMLMVRLKRVDKVEYPSEVDLGLHC